ncbi:kinase-like domain-containing protein [Gorgonomyces haynaldii]|nr:kinase-like domain-containing protein [Gorgonomyces haynaldii]
MQPDAFRNKVSEFKKSFRESTENLKGLVQDKFQRSVSSLSLSLKKKSSKSGSAFTLGKHDETPARPKILNFMRPSDKLKPDMPSLFGSDLPTLGKPVSPAAEAPSSPIKKLDVKKESDSAKRQRDILSLMNGTLPLHPSFTSRYILQDMLGDGAFGFVITATRKEDGTEVAVKFIVKSKISKDVWQSSSTGERLPSEIVTLMELDHPNIIRYVEHIVDKDYILLITELHGSSWDLSNPEINPRKNPGLKFNQRKQQSNKRDAIRKRTSCDLFECIDAHTQIPESTCKHIFAQIVLAVDYLMAHGMVHRDLKDENVVIDCKYQVKLIDFGSASKIPTQERHYFTKFNGTAHFASPEVSKGNAYRGPEAEIWALGVLLYTLVFGENPFQTKSDIIRGTFSLNSRKVSKELTQLLESMLRYDMSKRASIEDVMHSDWLYSTVKSLKSQYQKQFPAQTVRQDSGISAQ